MADNIESILTEKSLIEYNKLSNLKKNMVRRKFKKIQRKRKIKK